MAEQVLITGIGMVTSLGLTVEENWNNLINGKSGVRPISIFDASSLQTQIAAEVCPEFESYSEKFITKRVSKQMTRVTKMCYVAAKEAITNSQLDFANFDKSRCGVIIGVVSTGNTTSEKNTTAQNRVIKSMSNAMPAWISLEFELEGPNFSVSSACASSAYAMGLGYDLISSGKCDVVIVGGADSILNFEEIEGFNELYALCTENEPAEKASRPFSLNRDGFVAGEGAGVLILESAKSALTRNANIFGELLNYAISSEGYNIMAPKKDGEGIAFTIKKALEYAKVSPEDVQYINAHGTSTLLNDKYETMAIKNVFKEHAYKLAVSSSKSMLGHTIGAAGAIEAIITLLSIKNGIITPTINLDLPDPELDLDYVPHTARPAEITHALSNSFAFGGHNAVLVFKKY